MRPIVTFTVAGKFPEGLARLTELCVNLYWTWNGTIREFLRSIDPELWHQTNHQPLKVLQRLAPERLEQLASDADFLVRYGGALAELDRYLEGRNWYGDRSLQSDNVIAYFSAEFGLHESVPLYSGGLGVLSGDHTKAASDLGLPFVCVGLMYQMGYFQQRLTLDGTQIESYDFNDPSVLPLEEVRDAEGRPLRIGVEFPEAVVYAGVWKLQVGRVPVYLLDTNIRENPLSKYRDIADYLYGGDQETRIMQEMILGIGGMRALLALGIRPTVTHSNEGHSAFLMLERARLLMEEHGLSFAEAAEISAAGAIFTTHTPVPAGHDAFPPELIDRYFTHYWPRLGMGRDQFMSLGRVNAHDHAEPFSMTVLALKLSTKHNGVSQLHGEVSRDMWQKLWPGFTPDEIPIAGITNGVHTMTWISDPVTAMLDRHLPADWREHLADPAFWSAVESIPDDDVWATMASLRTQLVDYVHRRVVERQAEMYTRSERGRDLSKILDPDALTIGFARRFATYKRATLLFRDQERAYRLFTSTERPVQMIFAGKAHPKDQPGKEFVRGVSTFIRESGLEGKIVFLEDYDMAVARHMVQGCDVWLNTPRRPLEASGTSGMKAAINGTLNLSVLDGWWPEGYDGTNGFALGGERQFADHEHQDEFESRQLYRTLEESVVGAFYDRGGDGVPHEWVRMQKRSIATLLARFSAERMVREYAERFYFPCSIRYIQLREGSGHAARGLIAWKRRVREIWPGVRIARVSTAKADVYRIGQQVQITAQVAVGSLSAGELRIEAYSGAVDADGMIVDGVATPLKFTGQEGELATFTGSVPFEHARR
ncbi:MAG TPA: alpha-glucan family phosphorylase, partial [Candidatus Kapabacteria bacterium]|nr:alpha-glucan family phosphorylase [Candidatus Kapabacteria bacterium]